MRFDRHVLDNGLHIIGEANQEAQSMAVGFFVRTGARDETAEISGVSHFLEHMMFKGTARRTAEDINREFDEIGAQYNAFTSEENTVYYGGVLPEHQDRVIDLLADMMRPTLAGEDFEVEKQVILEEIALYQDLPHFVAGDLLRQTYFNGHVLGQGVLGTSDSIGALTSEQMTTYFRRRYQPGNTTVVLTGHYQWDRAIAQVQRLCGTWESGEATRVLEPFAAGSQQRLVTDERWQQAHLCWAMPGCAAQDEQRWAAAVLAQVVGDHQGSRLYWSLVHPGIAETAVMDHHAEDGVGEFFLYASCDPDQASMVVEKVEQTLHHLREEGLEPAECERAKRKIASAYVLNDETPFGRLVPTGFNWVYRQEQRAVEEDLDRILAIQPDEVMSVLATIEKRPLTLVALGPMTSL